MNSKPNYKSKKKEVRDIRAKAVSVRFTDEEFEAIRKKSFTAGVSIAVLCRESVLQKEIKARWTAEELDTRANLSGMANNLNQVVKAMHREGLLNSGAVIEKTIAEINKLLPI